MANRAVASSEIVPGRFVVAFPNAFKPVPRALTLIPRDVAAVAFAFDPEKVVGRGNAAVTPFELNYDFAEIGRILLDQLQLVAAHAAERFGLRQIFFLRKVPAHNPLNS